MEPQDYMVRMKDDRGLNQFAVCTLEEASDQIQAWLKVLPFKGQCTVTIDRIAHRPEQSGAFRGIEDKIAR